MHRVVSDVFMYICLKYASTLPYSAKMRLVRGEFSDDIQRSVEYIATPMWEARFGGLDFNYLINGVYAIIVATFHLRLTGVYRYILHLHGSKLTS